MQIVVSRTFYLSQNENHPYNKFFRDQSSFRDKLLVAIKGSPSGQKFKSIGEVLTEDQGWLEDSLVVRFEDIIGERGGGSKDAQFNTLKSIFRYIHLDVNDAWIEKLSKDIISPASPTFRKGSTRQWEQYFDNDLKTEFKSVAGEALIKYGYEADTNW